MQYSEQLLKYRHKKEGQESVDYFKFDNGLCVHVLTLSEHPTEERPVREIGIYTKALTGEWLPDNLLIEPLTDEEVNKILWRVHDENC